MEEGAGIDLVAAGPPEGHAFAVDVDRAEGKACLGIRSQACHERLEMIGAPLVVVVKVRDQRPRAMAFSA